MTSILRSRSHKEPQYFGGASMQLRLRQLQQHHLCLNINIYLKTTKDEVFKNYNLMDRKTICDTSFNFTSS
jgi:hypothetical protein